MVNESKEKFERIIPAIFKESCINCGDDISSLRLQLMGVCSDCLQKFVDLSELDKFERIKRLAELLRKNKRLKKVGLIYKIEKETKEFEEFFEKLVGNKPWSSQRVWARRALSGESFTIIAPTGVGKTTFGIILSLFLVQRRKNYKIYFILPTTTLVDQVYDRFVNFIEKLGDIGITVIRYSATLRGKERREAKKAIKEGKFDILITTSQFLARSFETLKGKKFNLIFVDDVDALLKSSKNIDKVLLLLGFSEKDIELAQKLLTLRIKVASAQGRTKLALQRRIERLEKYFERKRRKVGQLILSSATGRAKGRRVKLFRELLGFEVGGVGEGLRNVEDIVDYRLGYGVVLEYVKKLGKGGLIFVSKDLGIEEAEKIKEFLNNNGIRAETLHAKTEGKEAILEKYRNGEIDVLIGVAHFYGVLTRGIDLPEVIRYAIFYEVPRFKINATKNIGNVFFVIAILNILFRVLNDDNLRRLMVDLRRSIRNLSVGSILMINKYIRGEEVELNEKLKEIAEKIKEAQKIISDLLKKEDVLEKLKEYPYAYFSKEGEDVYVYLPDVATYIQASGRTSRLFAGGITKGISIVLSENKQLVTGLERKLRWRFFGFKFKEAKEVDWEKLIKEVDEDRKLVRLVQQGKILEIKKEEPIKSVLFIVESPNKARTIANFFGKPSKRRYGKIIVYEISTGKYLLNVVATVGHIFDLIEDEAYYGVITKPEEKKFIPIYGTIKRSPTGEQFVSLNVAKEKGITQFEDKKETIEILRKLAEEADLILIATDPDEEGEKIAWDVYNMLKFLSNKIKRAEFHEVTLPAILKALEEHRDINENWVKAQIVRRIEDRWIGFSLSKKLWDYFGKRWLSAGRVQTPVLGWVIERYDKRTETLHGYFRIKTESGLEFTIDFEEIRSEDELKKFEEELLKEKVKIKKIEVYEDEIKPLPPYDTEKMIADASFYLHFSAPKTMQLAQDLFEMGFITYHRTDSVRVSPAGIEVAKEFILQELKREDLFYPRKWGEGGAHECIRPTRPIDVDDLAELVEEMGLAGEITEDHLKLYDLIFRRFIASQMKPAKVRKVKYVLEIRGKEVEIEGICELIEPSFLKIYWPGFLKKLPKIDKKEEKVVEVKGYMDSPYELFTQGTLISEMRKRGIGRPSTYATIVKKLLDRGYVKEERGRLVPTDLGRQVYNFLSKYFGKFVSEERTRELEEKKDKIMEGKVDYFDTLLELYKEIQEVEKWNIPKGESTKV